MQAMTSDAARRFSLNRARLPGGLSEAGFSRLADRYRPREPDAPAASRPDPVAQAPQLADVLRSRYARRQKVASTGEERLALSKRVTAVRVPSTAAAEAAGFRRVAYGTYRCAHHLWEMRAAPDGQGHLMVRKHEERAPGFHDDEDEPRTAGLSRTASAPEGWKESSLRRGAKVRCVRRGQLADAVVLNVRPDDTRIEVVYEDTDDPELVDDFDVVDVLALTAWYDEESRTPSTDQDMQETQEELASRRRQDLETLRRLEEEGFPSQIGQREGEGWSTDQAVQQMRPEDVERERQRFGPQDPNGESEEEKAKRRRKERQTEEPPLSWMTAESRRRRR